MASPLSVAKALARLAVANAKPDEVILAALEEARDLPKELHLSLLHELVGLVGRSENAFARPTVAYAGELAGSDKECLGELISAKLGRTVDLRYELDASLIAGIRVCVGDRRWEFSLRRGLEQFLEAGR
ncbi:MAG: F0F1 ATP synthase subunit delta [Puniceicoccales bacterium]|jgi:hypothetical protein|nr:F0F1 ATP synthase subunit delta [Puniceicoccales bacterium]